MLNTELIQRS